VSWKAKFKMLDTSSHKDDI